MLSQEDKTELLKVARTTLQSYLTQQQPPEYNASRSSLRERKAAFVSLHHGDDLRGCIGQLYPDGELYKVVQHCVLSAALEDSRFMPVTRDELPDLNIEISVLTPFRHVKRVEDIEVGKHGLYIVQGPCRGLLLPQVAAEYGWDSQTFLKQTCRKAGLPESAWQDPQTQIHTFEAEVFSESAG